MQLRVDIRRQGPRCPFENEAVRMELGSGECLWLQGTSGAGKSSVALHLVGLRTLQDAEVEVEWTGIEAERAGDTRVVRERFGREATLACWRAATSS